MNQQHAADTFATCNCRESIGFIRKARKRYCAEIVEYRKSVKCEGIDTHPPKILPAAGEAHGGEYRKKRKFEEPILGQDERVSEKEEAPKFDTPTG